jgi:hypothetical protein
VRSVGLQGPPPSQVEHLIGRLTVTCWRWSSVSRRCELADPQLNYPKAHIGQGADRISAPARRLSGEDRGMLTKGRVIRFCATGATARTMSSRAMFGG